MNKKSLVAAAFLAMAAYPAMAQSSDNYAESAKKDLYDFSKYQMFEMLKYFRELHESGKRFPTSDEFKKKFGVDPEFVRSHVRKREVLKGDKNPYLFKNNGIQREDRHLWMNIPMGLARETGGYISEVFDNDPYTMWQYTELFGSWNHGFFQAPGSWADAAHKHGADLMSGIVFFDTTGGRLQGAETFLGSVIKPKRGAEYTYVKPLIHILMYLGLDGINYNWETSAYTDPDVVGFHKALRAYAKEVGFTNYRQGIYTLNSSISANGQYANSWLWDKNKQDYIGDIALNYSGDDFADKSGTSGEAAKAMTGKYDHLYSGAWIVTMKRSFSTMENVQTNLWLWGEHANSRFVTNNTGKTATEKMANYQKLYERAFSGGSRNVGQKDEWQSSDWSDQLSKFGGLSRMIPERTTLEQNLPFRTYFNTGAGERYFYKGKTSTSSWYNMSSQDYQPTYRWLQYAEGTKTPSMPIAAEFHYDDAYLGGTSLRLHLAEGAKGGLDLILYRGLLTVSEGNVVAKLALKTATETLDAHCSLLLHKKGAADTEYIVVPAKKLAGKTWEEQEFKVEGLKKGDVIDYIGLRVDKGAPDGYNMLVGGISIFDDAMSVAPKAPVNLRAEVKAETQRSLSAMLSWDAVALDENKQDRKDFGLLYNDEAGVDHFQIFYKDSENGKVREIGRTTTWAAYAPVVKFTKDEGDAGAEEPHYGVRAVGKDLKSMSEITWLKVERQSSAVLPAYKDDRYCKSEINKKADGYQTAITSRYLTDVKTEGATKNLAYHTTAPDPDGDNYVDATNLAFEVEQGQSIKFFFKAYSKPGVTIIPATKSTEDDGMRYCFAATYIDWNNNGSFEPEEGESIKDLELGMSRGSTLEFQTTGVNKTFTVPADAVPGKVRVRIVFTDAWAPQPTPCGVTAKGFTIDFDMEIKGDPEKARKSKDTRDQGEPEEPEMNKKPNPGNVESLVDGGNVFGVYPNPASDVLNFHNAERAWIFSLDGVLVRFIKDATVPANISDLPVGTYVVKSEKARVTRSHKFVKK
ncbi:MAG: GEVED domain-containing protein [Porphyromonadaceae bacterium]|nr:GEVED domain-containing protein [Porphyromonadaceae bacterium]